MLAAGRTRSQNATLRSKEYLRHFAPASDPEKVWTYDMRSRAFKLLPIEAVAQSPDYYSERDERRLNQEVEKPAQEPLNKLRTGSQITDEERRRVSVYVAGNGSIKLNHYRLL